MAKDLLMAARKNDFYHVPSSFINLTTYINSFLAFLPQLRLISQSVPLIYRCIRKLILPHFPFFSEPVSMQLVSLMRVLFPVYASTMRIPYILLFVSSSLGKLPPLWPSLPPLQK